MWSLPGKEIQAQGLSFWHALMWTTRDQKNEACYVGHCGLLIAQGWLSLLCWIHPAPVAAPHLEGAKLPLAAAAKPLVCFGSCLPSHQFCPYTSWWTLSQEALLQPIAGAELIFSLGMVFPLLPERWAASEQPGLSCSSLQAIRWAGPCGSWCYVACMYGHFGGMLVHLMWYTSLDLFGREVCCVNKGMTTSG